MAFVKSALQLIEEYGDSQSSDEDVPNGRVSVKRMFKEESNHLRIPLPNFMRTNQEIKKWVNKPEEHEGRIRSFDHENGNWATFVYIPYHSVLFFKQVVKELALLMPNLEMHLTSDFHISLTKTVILKYHWIHPFINSIKKNISDFKRFVILFNDIKIYCNENRTRTFVGITIKSGFDLLKYLVEALNNTLNEFQLPNFYEEPSFHMSILWCLGDHERSLNMHIANLNQKFQELQSSNPYEKWYIEVNYLYCNSGNKVFQFPLY